MHADLLLVVRAPRIPTGTWTVVGPVFGYHLLFSCNGGGGPPFTIDFGGSTFIFSVRTIFLPLCVAAHSNAPSCRRLLSAAGKQHAQRATAACMAPARLSSWMPCMQKASARCMPRHAWRWTGR